MCQNESSCFELAHATSVGPKQFSQQALSLDNRHEAEKVTTPEEK